MNISIRRIAIGVILSGLLLIVGMSVRAEEKPLDCAVYSDILEIDPWKVQHDLVATLNFMSDALAYELGLTMIQQRQLEACYDERVSIFVKSLKVACDNAQDFDEAFMELFAGVTNYCLYRAGVVAE